MRATFFLSFENSWWLLVERLSPGAGRSPASCFLCDHPGHEHGLCQNVCRGPARGYACLPSMDTRARNFGRLPINLSMECRSNLIVGSPFKVRSLNFAVGVGGLLGRFVVI